MNRIVNPTDIAPPFRNIYSHAIEVEAQSRMLWIAGQTGERPDGTMPDTFAGQAEQCFANMEAVLRAGSMAVSDIVKLNFFLKNIEDLELLRPLRTTFLNGVKPAITLVAVSCLAQPEWLIELEGVAASAKDA